MTVCLSTNGPSNYVTNEPPLRLLVATTHGISVVERERYGAPWRVTGQVMEGHHVSALMIVPGAGMFAGVHRGAVYHSADDGLTWERRSNGITIEHIYCLGYRERPDGVALYAGTEPVSLFTSRDNGMSWSEWPAIGKVPGHEKWTFPPPPHHAHTKNFLFDPRDPDVFYATIEQGALLKTNDGGKSWRELGSFYRPDDVWYKDIHRLVYRPSNPDQLYMATGIGLYYSADAGETWERRTDMNFRIGYPDQIIISPLNENVMFMSGAERDPSTWHSSHYANGTVLRSRDGGRSWEDANRGLPSAGHANIEAMNVASYPGGYMLIAGNTDGEVYTSDDEGENWSRVVAGLKPVSKGGHFRNLQVATA